MENNSSENEEVVYFKEYLKAQERRPSSGQTVAAEPVFVPEKRTVTKPPSLETSNQMLASVLAQTVQRLASEPNDRSVSRAKPKLRLKRFKELVVDFEHNQLVEVPLAAQRKPTPLTRRALFRTLLAKREQTKRTVQRKEPSLSDINELEFMPGSNKESNEELNKESNEELNKESNEKLNKESNEELNKKSNEELNKELIDRCVDTGAEKEEEKELFATIGVKESALDSCNVDTDCLSQKEEEKEEELLGSTNLYSHELEEQLRESSAESDAPQSAALQAEDFLELEAEQSGSAPLEDSSSMSEEEQQALQAFLTDEGESEAPEDLDFKQRLLQTDREQRAAAELDVLKRAFVDGDSRALDVLLRRQDAAALAADSDDDVADTVVHKTLRAAGRLSDQQFGEEADEVARKKARLLDEALQGLDAEFARDGRDMKELVAAPVTAPSFVAKNQPDTQGGVRLIANFLQKHK